MALHPAPFDPVPGGGVEQLLPQLRILDRLAVGSLPAVPAPAVDPFGDAVAYVGAVGVEDDVARLVQRLECPDRGEQLHPVVGGERLPAGNLLFPFAGADHGAPAARARIALARAVGENLD